MPSIKIALALLLVMPMAFAQRGPGVVARAGHGGGPPAAHGVPAHTAAFGTTRAAIRAPYRAGPRSGVRRQFGYGPGYGWPYVSGWDYGSVLPLYGSDFAGEYQEEYPVGTFLSIPAAGGEASSQTYAPTPVNSVMHEYNFVEQPGTSGSNTTFTIVLKDGSSRSATATWTSGGKLHYLDSEERQQVLAPGLIDRDATEQANQAKKLSITLPPG